MCTQYVAKMLLMCQIGLKMGCKSSSFGIIWSWFCFHRTESALLGHFRLSQEVDNQVNIFAVVSKKKDEVRAGLI